MDPALIDRTANSILGIDMDAQPVRNMTIAGIEDAVPAKILSTDLRGAATRLLRIPPGWGSRLSGSFTASISVFVLKGSVQAGSVTLSDYELVTVPAHGVIGGFRSETGAVALFMTSAPIRFDTSTGGAQADLTVGRPSASTWQRDEGESSLFTRALASSGTEEAWLGSTRQDPASPVWHRHTSDQETLVLDGDVRYVDLVDGRPVVTQGSPGTYFYRPAETAHAGPATTGDTSVVTFNRSLGHRDRHLLDETEVQQA